MIIIVKDFTGNFAENKDIARTIRDGQIKPFLKKQGQGRIIIDFQDIDSSTQSFIHALISGFFQSYKEDALDMFEFKNCNKAVQSLITTVINYSLE